MKNLYVHFPFCRTKCTYCALYSRAEVPAADRDRYAAMIATAIVDRCQTPAAGLETVYFGGGSPALCDLRPVLSALDRILAPGCEFTVELHPRDIGRELLETLKGGGVNRISMGVQSLADATLADMRRGYTVEEAHRAFDLVRRYFDNAGIDLIAGYPGDDSVPSGLDDWGLRHCSVYSLQNERGLKNVPSDDIVLDRIRTMAGTLKGMGLERYEISNYAVPGSECRHNLAVWRGEDYLGLGEGAHGRTGLRRTRGVRGAAGGIVYREETVSPEFDRKERTLFRLRTREGLDASGFPEWTTILDRFVSERLLEKVGRTYFLTDRGTEVCDSILEELV